MEDFSVPLDLADIAPIIAGSDNQIFSTGIASSPEKAVAAAFGAAACKNIDVAILQINGGHLTTHECASAVKELIKKLPDNADIVWGAKTDEKLGNDFRVLLLTGTRRARK